MDKPESVWGMSVKATEQVARSLLFPGRLDGATGGRRLFCVRSSLLVACSIHIYYPTLSTALQVPQTLAGLRSCHLTALPSRSIAVERCADRLGSANSRSRLFQSVEWMEKQAGIIL
jgi:hypothetical protein